MLNKVEELQCENILPAGNYYIYSALSKNKVLRVGNGNYENNSNVNIWDKIDKEYQKFNISYDTSKKSYIIKAIHSRKVLDVSAAGQDNGANVAQYESNNTDAQRWVLKETEDGYYSIISKCNELYLDISGARIENGTNVQTYEGNGTKAQKFKFLKAEVNVGEQTIDDGIYNIVPKCNNDKVIEMEGQSTANNKKIQIAKKLGVINKSQGFKVAYIGDGYYKIQSLKSEKALEVVNGSHSNGAQIQQNDENDSNMQQWIIKKAENDYYYLISRCNALYLDVPGGRAENETKLQMYEGNNTNAQKFKFLKLENELKSEKTIEDGYYTISSMLNNNKVLDISGGSFNNSANLQIWDRAYVQQQKYKVTYNNDEKYYSIQSVNSGKYIDVCGNGKTDGTNVMQYEGNNTMAQRWAIQKADNGSYYIVALNSDLYLDISGGNTANGTNVQIYEGNESKAQKFKFEPALVIEENYYKVSIKKDTNKYLDIDGGSNNENANLQIWNQDNVNQQVYSFENIDGIYYKIIARHSNKVLTVLSNNNVVQASDKNEDNQQWSIEIAGNGYYKIKNKAIGFYLDVVGNGTTNGTNVQVYEGNDSVAQMFKFNTLLNRRGIDVSNYNGDINWQIVKRFGNIDYAIIRTGYRGYRTGKIVTDSSFEENIAGIKENRIDVGLYFYTQAVNTQEAIEEANYVINLARQHNLHLKYPIYIDTERSTAAADNPGRADNLDRYTRTAICRAFCDTIRNAGYIPGIYASKYWFYNDLDLSQLGGYDIWVAHYTGSSDKQTDYRNKYDMWQYTSSGWIPGINTVVDMNLCYKNY